MSEVRPPMMREAHQWLEIVMTLPDGEKRFQHELMAAEMAEGADPLKTIGLAYAALSIASAGQAGMFEGWYRDKAMSLLLRAGEVLAAMRDKSGASVQ